MSGAQRALHFGVLTLDGHTPAKLNDFGALAPMSASPQRVGTAPFVSPEAHDARSDLFTFGNTLYFALSSCRS